MEYRKMGRTGLKVSAFCLGTMTFGKQVDEPTSMRIIERALDLGVNFIDTADMYVNGVTEQIVAKANLPLVNPVCSDKTATLAGVSWMFSCAPSDAAIARVLVDAVVAEMKGPGDKCVLLATTDHESRMTAREVVREFSRRGRRPPRGLPPSLSPARRPGRLAPRRPSPRRPGPGPRGRTGS